MAKIVKNNLGNFYPEPSRRESNRRVLVILVIFSLVMGWWFSGWPQIWPLDELGVNEMRIPPEIKNVNGFAFLSNPAKI